MNKYTILPIIAALLIAAPAFADDKENAAKRSPKPTPDLACIKRAVDTRETSLGTAFSNLSTKVSAAYTARKAELAKAYDITDAKARRVAVRTAFKNFSISVKSAREEFRKSREGAWKTFETDRKACRFNDEGTASDKSSDTVI